MEEQSLTSMNHMGYKAHMPDLDCQPPSAVPTFTPVPNRTRAGWTPAKQQLFIETLLATGSVRLGTEAAGMSHGSVYRLRHAPGGTSFARAWDEAVALGAQRVRDVLIDQAIHGIPERVLVGKETVVERRRFNHRTMIWVLQHHMPEDYPGGSTTHRGGWGKEAPEPAEAVRARLEEKMRILGLFGAEEPGAGPPQQDEAGLAGRGMGRAA